jgi:hypothetical protein
MKHQYFGDINDYRKYGLLRSLTGPNTLSLAVCWMLTEADSSSDGALTQYLEKPAAWRRYDPVLFDCLSKCISGGLERNVQALCESALLGKVTYFADLLTDELSTRTGYFQRFLEKARGVDLVFFDPDNGMEVKSKLRGHRGSSKYLYWDELKATYGSGHSVLIFQYFSRAAHKTLIEKLATKIGVNTQQDEILWFSTARVLFVLASQPRHLPYFRERCSEISRHWLSQIEVGTTFVNPTLGA